MKVGGTLVGISALCGALGPTRLLGTLQDALGSGDRNKVLGLLEGLRPAAPASVEEASRIVQAAAVTTPNIVEYGAQLLANGVKSESVGSLFDHASGLGPPENGHDNE